MNPELSRKRILFVAREFTTGGAAMLALRHIRRLADLYGIDLLVTGPCDGEMLAALPEKVVVHRFDSGVPNHKNALIDCHEWFGERRNRSPISNRYAAVLGTSVFPDMQACVAFTMLNAPRKLLFLVDESMIDPSLNTEVMSAMKSCILASDLILPVSGGLFEKLAAHEPLLKRLPMTVMHPPLEEDRGCGLPAEIPWNESSGLPVVLTVARLSPEKRIGECVGIQHRLRTRGVDFLWYVVGAGQEELVIRSEISRLGMDDRFFLAGRRESPRSWMKECDVFALFSRSEGCPTVVMEALQEGKPVIVTKVNGVEELIDHGRTGLVVDHAENAIEEGLALLVSDAALRHRLSANLREGGVKSDAVQERDLLVKEIEAAPEPATRPEVTILIPAYNHESTINRAIASALMQDFRALEVVVCDDASTDATQLAAKEWESDPRFRYVRQARNLGRVANYRKALEEHASGEWVLMLDGDDYLTDPGFIRNAVEALARHDGKAPLFVQAGHRVVYRPSSGSGGRVSEPVDILPDIPDNELIMTGGDYLRFVYQTGFFTHLGTLYNREAAIAGRFYTRDISSSDMDSLLRLALEGNVLVFKAIAGCWVQHGGNASSNLPLRKIAENVRIFREIAGLAVKRKLFSMAEINRCLVRYESGTLAHLLGTTVGKSARNPLDGLRMLGVIASVHPRILLERDLMRAWMEYFRRLALIGNQRAISRVKSMLKEALIKSHDGR